MKNILVYMALILFGVIIIYSCKEKSNDCKQLLGTSYTTYEEVVLAIKGKAYQFQDSVNINDGERLKFARYFSCNGATGYLVLSYKIKPEDYRCDVPLSIWNEFKKSNKKETYFDEKIATKFIGKVTVSNVDSQKYEYHICE